jgi:hypothetical protein
MPVPIRDLGECLVEHADVKRWAAGLLAAIVMPPSGPARRYRRRDRPGRVGARECGITAVQAGRRAAAAAPVPLCLSKTDITAS